MRKVHRWLSVIFGIFLLWIAATGLLSHGAALYADAVEPRAPSPSAAANPLIPTAQAHDNEMMARPAARTAAPAAAAPADFVCPETMNCRPKPDPDSAAAWVSFFHHIHAGEEFGLVGTIISILSGFALLFFALSGLYMYIQMYRRRSHRHSHPKRIFW